MTSSSSSDSDEDEIENKKTKNDYDDNNDVTEKNSVDFLVREAMREEKLKLKSKLKEEKKKRTTVLPGEDDDDDDGALNGAKAKETEEEAMIEMIKSKETIEDATRARKRARTLLGKADDFNEEEEENSQDDGSPKKPFDEEEEEEAKMDRFDMSKEEREGYFDRETGNYVEYKKDKKLAEDSWIDETTKEEYEKFKTVKPSSQRLMEAEKAAEEDEEMKYDQTEEGVAKLKRRLAELLEGSTETALRAIKRVGGGSGGPGNNSKNKYVSKQKSMKNGKTKQQEKKRGKSVKLEGENKKIFDEITAIASRLVAAGEYGAYTIEKQMLEKSANLVLKLEAKTTYEDVEDDMFADSDDDDDEGVRKSTKKGPAETESAAVAASVVDSKTFSIKELKRCLESHGKSIGAGGGERIDIEKMCLEALKSTIAPDGFAYDKSTGLYYGEASKMHWHCKANVYKTEDGNWWNYNGQMFEAASEP